MSQANISTPDHLALAASQNKTYTGYYRYHDDERLDIHCLTLMNFFFSLIHNGKSAYPSNAFLAKFIRLSVRNLQIKLRWLEDNGYIRRHEINRRRFIEVLVEGIIKGTIEIEPSMDHPPHDPGITPPRSTDHPYNKKDNKKKIIKDLSPSPKPRAKKAYDCPYFNQFYESYPRKADKADAFKEFKKLTKDMSDSEKQEFVEMLKQDIAKRLQANWVDKQFIPYPHRYLSKQKYEEEILTQTPARINGRPKLDHFTTDWGVGLFPEDKNNQPAIEQGNIYDA